MTSESTPAARGRETGRARPGARGRLPRRPLVAGLAAAAAALPAGCGSGNGSVPAASGAAGTRQKDAAGITISHARGGRRRDGADRPVREDAVHPQQEARGVIRCTAGCLSFWFPVTVGNGATPRAAGTLTGTLGPVQRPDDGSRQLAYNGHPLYTFRLDDAPGQVHGNNFTDKFGGQTFTWRAAVVGSGTPTPGQPGGPSGSNPYQGGPSGSNPYQGGSAGYWPAPPGFVPRTRRGKSRWSRPEREGNR